MAIDYIRRTESMEIECDNCGILIDFAGSFPECIEQAQKAGWIILKDGFNFVHFCDKECEYEFNNPEK